MPHSPQCSSKIASNKSAVKTCGAGTSAVDSNTEHNTANTFQRETILDSTNVAQDVSESNTNAEILSQADVLGLFQGLNDTYNLGDAPPQDQLFRVVMDGSSMYLVGPLNQVYLSLKPQEGDVASPDSQMLCTLEPNTDRLSDYSDITANCSVSITISCLHLYNGC